MKPSLEITQGQSGAIVSVFFLSSRSSSSEIRCVCGLDIAGLRRDKHQQLSCFCFHALAVVEHDFLNLFLAVSSGPVLGLRSALVAEVSDFF